jgi:periplasmic protein TonB
MKRLAVAAVLAAGLHGAAFWVAGPWSQPVLPLARRQSVTINLVTIQASAATAPAPAPRKIQPPPEPRPRQIKKPAPKPLVRPRPVPHLRALDPAPAPPMAMAPPPSRPTTAEQPPAETDTAAPTASGPISHQEHAAIRESVPLYDRNPPPVYPRVARRRNYQGTVLLDVRVSADGTVAEAKVAQSSGYSVLDRSALNSVHHWLFEPARRGDRAIETWVQVPVRFELH